VNRRTIRVVGAMLEREPGRYLITQRSKNASLPLLWEFPGGRVIDGERDEEALKREMQERLGLDVIVTERRMATRHEYAEYVIDFHVFRCALVRGDQTVSHERVNDHRFVALEEMSSYEFPSADARTLAKLLGLEN